MKPPSEMTTEELASVIVRFRKAAELEKMCRAEYIRRMDAGDEPDEMIEVCEGRETASWTDPKRVLELLHSMSNTHNFSLLRAVQPLGVTALMQLIDELDLQMPGPMERLIRRQKGSPFTRLKPQKDPDEFRD